MNTFIDADAAKLAGLQMDMLKKMREKKISLQDLEHFVRGELVLVPPPAVVNVPAAKPVDPFKLLDEFDVVVPKGFKHKTCLAEFKKNHEKEFYYFNPAFTDENFAKASTQLAPGRKLKVKIFGFQRVSSEQCLDKIREEKGVPVGAQGLTLAYLQGKAKLIKGKWHLSPDKKEALPKLDGYRLVPRVDANSSGGFDVFLGSWDGDWDDRYCLLVFCDSE